MRITFRIQNSQQDKHLLFIYISLYKFHDPSGIASHRYLAQQTYSYSNLIHFPSTCNLLNSNKKGPQNIFKHLSINEIKSSMTRLSLRYNNNNFAKCSLWSPPYCQKTLQFNQPSSLVHVRTFFKCVQITSNYFISFCPQQMLHDSFT